MASAGHVAWAVALQAAIASHQRDLDLLVSGTAARSTPRSADRRGHRTLFEAMEFGLLFDADRQLLSIGYRVGEGHSIKAITTCSLQKRGSPASSRSPKAMCRLGTGFTLGERVTSVHGSAALVSWSGSMFEYLMPDLVMRAAPGCSARRNQPQHRAPTETNTVPNGSFRGASRNRPITRATWSSRTSIQALAFPVSGSSAASATMPSSHLTRRLWRR